MAPTSQATPGRETRAKLSDAKHIHRSFRGVLLEEMGSSSDVWTPLEKKMSNITLTREIMTAFARIDNAGLSHAQRIHAMAKAIGFETGASLMSTLKAAEGLEKAPAAAKPAVSEEKHHQAVVIWGREAISLFTRGETIGEDDVLSWSVASFATEAELTAYTQGVNDAYGWSQSYVAESTNSSCHSFIDALKADPEIDLAAWHNERMTEDLEDLDEGGDPALN